MNERRPRINVVLIGNPNTGKTSLLNSLTGMSLHVGNWPGKTVEKKEGRINFEGYELNIIDLPGTYSIAPYSEEEKVTYDFLMNNETDVIIQTIDVNALERNLLMTFELLALGKKLALAFNFNREAARQGLVVDVAQISRQLQVPVVEVEANRGENKDALLEEVIKLVRRETIIPAYIKNLMKENREIHHDESLKFIKEKISPYYSTAKISRRTEFIDSLALNKYLAFPIFFIIILTIFAATFLFSTPLVNLIDSLFHRLGGLVSLLNLSPVLQSLLVEGVIGGVGSVLSFTPLIFILFLSIAVLEDSGYLGRAVVLVDRIFHKFGISGRSFIPMILGFGCNVPAIMATRTIREKKERLIAIFINSFMSCGARLPVYAFFCGIFFPKGTVLVIMFLYLAGVMIAFIAAWLLSKIIKDTEKQALIIELPPYRAPTLKNIVKHAWFHTSEFIKRAGTIIFGSVVVIWILSSLPVGVKYGSAVSLAGRIGRFITPLFQPLGFGDWSFAIALITGFVAKEVIIGTLSTIHGAGPGMLALALPRYLTPLGALSFLIFVLLYVPCAATIAVMRKESNSWLFVAVQVVVSLSVAWLAAFAVYHTGLWLGFR